MKKITEGHRLVQCICTESAEFFGGFHISIVDICDSNHGLLQKTASTQASRGAETRGGYIPPVICLYPPNSLRMVHICIFPNNLNGCTAERKFVETKSSILAEDLFFFSFLVFT